MQSIDSTHYFGEWSRSWILRYRFYWLIFLGLLILAAGFGLPGLKMDASNETFLPESDELYAANERFKEVFGNEEFLILLVESKDLFTNQVLGQIDSLTRDLEERLPFVEEVTSLTNIESIDADQDGLRIDPLVPEKFFSTPQDKERTLQKIHDSKMFLDKIITRDLKSTLIVVRFEKIPKKVWVQRDEDFYPLDELDRPDEEVVLAEDVYYAEDQAENPKELVAVMDPRKLIYPALRVILKEHRSDDIKLTATGVPIIDFESERASIEENKKLAIISLVGSLLFLLILFRNFFSILGPFVVILPPIFHEGGGETS